MKSFKFKKIDAFTNGTSSGNPAGVVYLDTMDAICRPEMQRIARELKGFVSEVGYICQTGKSDFELKYYSSEREVDFCGHATIAIMYELLSSREDLQSKECVHIHTNKGRLPVYNRIRAEDAVFISAPEPVFSERVIPLDEISKALCIKSDAMNYPISDITGLCPSIAIDVSKPVAIVNAGLETLIVPFGGLDDILALKPDMERLKEFCIKNALDIITVYSKETTDPGNSFRTRVFAPTFGYLEDPATGSGNSAFGYYLLKNGHKPEGTLFIEQNGFRECANIVKLELMEMKDGTPRVLFGGNAVVRICGEYCLA